MSNLIKRTVPVILVLALCLTCLVSPVSAASFDQLSMYNLLDYTSLNEDGSNNLSVVGDHTFVFSTPNYSYVGYLDILVTISGGNDNIAASVASSSTGTSRNLNVDLIGTNLYRISGNVPYSSYRRFYLTITSSSQENRGYNFLSFDVCNSQYDHYDLGGKMSVSSGFGSADITFDPGATATLDFPLPSTEGNYAAYYRYNFYPYNCENYDYIFISLYAIDLSIDSISARWDDTVVPISFLSSFDSYLPRGYINLLLDVSSISRTNGTDGNVPVCLTINGEHDGSPLGSHSITVYRCYGVVDIEEPSQFRLLILKLESLFSSLQDKLDEVFGTNDTSAEDAAQTQEEINVSINTQLVGAVEDWNTNIEVVQTGYDSALTKATPALGWLASLADGIFSGMGWFGNIYFLVGLISVIMLVLSKSGLARSVSRIRRNE